MKHRNVTMCGALVGMLVLIFDGQTAIAGMRDGIEICLRTLIPSLFPFIVLSGLITSTLAGQPIHLLAPVSKLWHMSPGSEAYFGVGILGGYPVGAANLATAHRSGHLTPETATNLAVFCNNAGPAFIFGVLGIAFPEIARRFTLWFVQILAALITGHLMGNNRSAAPAPSISRPNATNILNHAIRSMAGVCGWVVLFRMCLTFLNKWILFLLPQTLRVLMTGLLELSNGCLLLNQIEDPSLRFLIATVMLSLGGFCVLMQTKAVFPELQTREYLGGKLIHLYFSVFLALAAVSILEKRNGSLFCGLAAVGIIIPIQARGARKSKKEVAIP